MSKKFRSDDWLKFIIWYSQCRKTILRAMMHKCEKAFITYVFNSRDKQKQVLIMQILHNCDKLIE